LATTKGAVWMTMAAAAGTLVIVIGVIAGPSIYQCTSSADGLLSCLRQDVVEAGLLPPAETPPAAPTEVESAPPPAVQPEPQPPSPDVSLIRAEPDGNVIIAGSAEPGIEVEVFANGDLVGKVIAEASGDWVLVPDRPLAVGSAEISVGIAGSNARSPHTFTVTIPEDRVSQPVITVSEPALPVEAVPAPEPEVATAEPEVLPMPSAQPEVLPVPPASEQTLSGQPEVLPVPPASEQPLPPPRAATSETDPAPQPPVETATASLPAAPPHVEQPLELAEAQPESLPLEPAELEPTPQPSPSPQPNPAPPAPEPQPTASQAVPHVATAEPVPEPSVPAVIPVPPQPATIDAIEIDGAANYFAGAGPEGATVQLYVQDRFIASAKVEGGRWLVEAQGALTLPVQRVRIDLIEPQRGDVSARAEVNFVIDVPPPAPGIEAAAAATGQVTPAATASAELAIAPQVESELEVDPAIPTLRALPSVEPGMLRFASGKAIIRRGETLWAIAERVYGDGSRYRLIVDANPDLITRPGRIFPGQVFELPKVED